MSEEWREVLVVTSDGRYARDRQPMIRFGVRAVAEENGKRQGGRSGGGGRRGMEYFQVPDQSPEEHGREAARLAIAMLDAAEAPAGPMPVVLGPGESASCCTRRSATASRPTSTARRPRTTPARSASRSPASCARWSTTAPWATRAARSTSTTRATPGASNVLIENGILVGYMHDRISSRHFKLEPTGNGRRESFRHEPLPRMTNTLLLAGQDDPEEIIKSVKRGIYAKRFSGGQVNISNGDFVFSLTESYLIEDGKLTAPLKGVNLIGNGPEVLRRVDMLGNDFELSDGIWTCGKDGQSVPVGVGTPTVRISAITVGGTQHAMTRQPRGAAACPTPRPASATPSRCCRWP